MFWKSPVDKKKIVVGFIISFLAGWIFFSYFVYSNQILVVGIQGTIVDFEATTLHLYAAEVDEHVKATILYFNTPGGLAYPCLEIASYVAKLAEKKPVIAVMGAQCASGGYYIASFSSHIYTRENTLTGGVGVISVWVDLSEYYEEQGINIWIWKSGAEKDLGADWRPPTPEESAAIEETVNEIFTKLINNIEANRNLSEEEVTTISSGTVFLGSTAIELGLVDEIGNIVNAIEKAAETTHLWKFIVVSPDMNEVQRFIHAMFWFV